jgi:hypothetical protein
LGDPSCFAGPFVGENLHELIRLRSGRFRFAILVAASR